MSNHNSLTLPGGLLIRALQLKQPDTRLLVMPFFTNRLAAMGSYKTGDNEPSIDTHAIKECLDCEAITIDAINAALNEDKSIMFYLYGKEEALRNNLEGSRQTLTPGPATAARTAIRHGVAIVPIVEMVAGGLEVAHGIDNDPLLNCTYKASGYITRYCGLPGLVPCMLCGMKDKNGVSIFSHALKSLMCGFKDWCVERGSQMPLDMRAVELEYLPSFHLVGKPISPEGYEEKDYKAFDQKVRLHQDALLVIAHLIQPIYSKHHNKLEEIQALIEKLQNLDPQKLVDLRDALHADSHKQKNPLYDVQQKLLEAFKENNFKKLNDILVAPASTKVEEMKRD